MRLYFDASGSGFAAVLGSRWFQGSFPSSWAPVSIAVKELLPIVLAVRLWAPFLANSRILFVCDNMSVVSVINSQTSRDVSIVQLLRELVVACMRHYIQLASKHVPGKTNIIADALSRFQNDSAHRAVPWLNQQADLLPADFLPW